jgi:hypothetical protein
VKEYSVERSCRLLFAASLLLCGAALSYVGCGGSGPEAGPGPRAAAGEAGADGAPPGIKKGVKIRFRPVAASGLPGTHGPWSGEVQEVRGKWLKVLETGSKVPEWYNMDNFIWYNLQEP